jgi:5'(3')-deoxyribonucleotidase
MTPKYVYLDLDGPMVDWEGGVYKLFNTEPPSDVRGFAHEILGVSKNEVWKRIYNAGPNWWANLEPTPWAHELYNELGRAGEVVICSSPSHIPHGASGKVMWMKKFFNGNFRDYILTSRKECLAKPGDILIDDMEKNTSLFSQRGGLGILFPRPWNREYDYSEQALEITLEQVSQLVPYYKPPESINY